MRDFRKDGVSGVGEKRKACHGDSEEEEKCVCVGFNGKWGRGEWGKRLFLETSENLKV
jgi:hypothetical protein